MKGNSKLIKALNSLLAEELMAINQYMVHSEMCGNWGFTKLHKDIRGHAMTEMYHAEWLIERIIYLNGVPDVSKPNHVQIGSNVEEIVTNDLDAEQAAIKEYNDAIALAVKVGDNGTRDLLAKILADEEKHVDWAERQHDQIQLMGLKTYLSTQV